MLILIRAKIENIPLECLLITKIEWRNFRTILIRK